jgi:hypothetical protein
MLATPRDIQASVAIIAVYAFTALIGIPKTILDAFLTQPIFTRIVWLALICGLLFTKHYLTAVLVVVLGLRISFESTSSYLFSTQGTLAEYAAIQKNDPRFDAASEVDIKMANETLRYDPARWVDPGRPVVPLLLFPPTAEQLSMIGNNGK